MTLKDTAVAKFERLYAAAIKDGTISRAEARGCGFFCPERTHLERDPVGGLLHKPGATQDAVRGLRPVASLKAPLPQLCLVQPASNEQPYVVCPLPQEVVLQCRRALLREGSAGK